MNKKFIFVSKLTVSVEKSFAIAAGVLIMLFSNDMQAQVSNEFVSSPIKTELAIPGSATFEENSVTLQLSENVETIEDKLNSSFEIICKETPDYINLAPAHQFLTEISSNIGAVKATVSCNSDYSAVTHSLRLPHDFILTLTKPTETLDDTKVMFNLMRNRKLLISDVVENALLREYIVKVMRNLG